MNRDITFHHIFSIFKKIFFLNAIIVLLMSVFRLIFLLYFGDMKHIKGLHYYVFKAFVIGWRFDLAAVAYINALVAITLLVCWCVGKRRFFTLWLTALKFYYTFMYFIVFFILCVDFGFYSYFKNHINILIFGIFEDDTKALFSTLNANYNLLLVAAGFTVLLILLYTLCRALLREHTDHSENPIKRYALGYRVGFALLILPLNFLAARGTVSMFPLGTMNAEISPDIFINKLGINGVYTLEDALDARLKEKKDYNFIKITGYDNNIENAFADFLQVKPETLNKDQLCMSLVKTTPVNKNLEKTKPNVVVIMMESFGIDLTHYNSETFNVLGELKKHFDADYVFSNFLSGDVGTIGSIETVNFNVPKRPMSKPISQSKYAFGPHISGSAMPYKNAGYDTIFLYGGNIGWRNLISVLPHLGFDTAEGDGAMPASYLRNQWGVYDEYLFDYIYQKLSNNNGKSKFIFAMSTSNHPPYSLPPSYQKLPLAVPDFLRKKITGDYTLAQEHFMTYQYANQKLGELITRIKNSKYGNNTIIAVTGDHNFWSVFDYSAEQYLDLDGVPFYLYIPDSLKPAKVDTTVFGSHVDIMPTLYNISLSAQQYVSIGANMIDDSSAHRAFNVDGLVMSKDAALRYEPETGAVNFYCWDPSTRRRLMSCSKTKEHDDLLTHYKAALAVTEYLLRNPGK
jgi:phosphoglycerol transferase MdoB-like AlkP superfamily enzyme